MEAPKARNLLTNMVEERYFPSSRYFPSVVVEMVGRFDFHMPAGSGELEFVNPSPVLRLKGGLKVEVQRRV